MRGTDQFLAYEDKQMIAEDLSAFLADSYALYLKLQNFHWNVKGMHFHDLHVMFEEQYRDIADAVDIIAERVSALGSVVPGSFKEFLDLSTMKESIGERTAKGMMEEAAMSHELLADKARMHVEVFEDKRDYGSADLLIERMRAHEKAAWMLRSMLGEG